MLRTDGRTDNLKTVYSPPYFVGGVGGGGGFNALRDLTRKVVDVYSGNVQVLLYINDPKYSDSQVWANSEKPDQTAPEVSFCHSIRFYTFRMPYCTVT